MSEDANINKNAPLAVNLQRLVMCFEHHISALAFFYVLATYLIFVLLDIFWLKIPVDDPYGIAMILIGLFYLGLIGLAKLLKEIYT